MQYSFFLPTQVIHGENCVRDNAQLVSRLGKKALLVTGRSSAKLSGAWDDVVAVLTDAGIEYEAFTEVEPNPSLANVTAGGNRAREYQPDFIIAIGGGSPLDAAKAIATLAVNDIPADELFSNQFAQRPLPIVAIPTTAGTGSEVTPYSILTDPKQETKRSFSVPEVFPVIAFLDYRYTMGLPVSVTINTGVDALSHLVEGYLSLRATDFSSLLAQRGIELWAQCIPALKAREFSAEVRDKLLVASTLGGFTISHTGTTLVHALGYSLTYYHGLPHGHANGVLMGEYLRFTAQSTPDRVEKVLGWLGLGSVDGFIALMDQLLETKLELSEAEIGQYAQKAMKTRNISFSQGQPTEEDLRQILSASCR